jgi:hypothetical protein
MPTISKFAAYHTPITTGYTNPSNAYADDGVYATAAPAKNAEVSAYFGFPAFTTDEIPDGATINSVTTEFEYRVSTTASIATQYWQTFKGTTGLGTEQSDASEPLTDVIKTHQVTTGITLTDLRTDNNVRMRLRSVRGNSNTAVTFYIDYVKITVDYTVPSFVYGSAVLSGIGALSAIGALIKYGLATLSGMGNLTGIGRLILAGSSILSGIGSLVTRGVRTLIGQATLAGEGALLALGGLLKQGAAVLSGVGSLTAIGSFLRQAAATLSGIGSLTATGVRILIGQATLAGEGIMSAIGSLIKTGIATLSGIGNLMVNGVKTVVGRATLLGEGILSAIGTVISGTTKVIKHISLSKYIRFQ